MPQWRAQPVYLQAALALVFTVFVIVKWAMYEAPLFRRGHAHPAPEGILIFAPLSVWLMVLNASRFWRPSTRAQLAASEVRREGAGHTDGRVCVSVCVCVCAFEGGGGGRSDAPFMHFFV